MNFIPKLFGGVQESLNAVSQGQKSCATIIFTLFVSSFGIQLFETFVTFSKGIPARCTPMAFCLLHSTRTDKTEIRNVMTIKVH